MMRQAIIRVTQLAYLLMVGNYFSGISPALESSKLLQLLAWTFAILKSKKNTLPLWMALLWFPKFRLGLGRADADEIPLGEHLFRLIVFRRYDAKLVPSVPWFYLVYEAVLKQGFWQRHQAEVKFTEKCGDSHKILFPFQRHDWTKPATIINFLSDPVDVEQVLTDKTSFPTRGHTGFSELLGEGLLGMHSGKQHAKHRALIIGFLSDSHLRGFSTVVTDQIEILLGKWGCGAGANSTNQGTVIVNAQYDLSMLTLDVIMLTAFGAGKEHLSQLIPEKLNHTAHDLDMVLKDIIIRTAIPGYEHIPSPIQFNVNRAMKEMNQVQDNLYADCVKHIENEPDAPNTILSEMLKTKKNGEEGLSDSEIANELITIRGAGHETTSNTLCWTMLLLSQNPDKLAKLRMEVDALVAGSTCTFDESKTLKYASQVIFETLRLYPTVPQFPRECHQDVRLKSGYDIFAGSLVLVAQSSMNRSKRIWGEDALEFVPERFNGMGEIKMGVPVGVPNGGPKYGFAPFGAANRSCVGQRLAMLESIQILASLVKRCDWVLANPEKKVVEVADVTLGPKEGLIFKITPRRRDE